MQPCGFRPCHTLSRVTHCIEQNRRPLFWIAQRSIRATPTPNCGPRGSVGWRERDLCTREQHREPLAPYTGDMQLNSLNATVTALWVAAVSTVGIAGNLTIQEVLR